MGIYKNIQVNCKRAGKTVAGLEIECGFGRGSIAKWDDHSPSIKKVKAVADALCTTVDALVRGDDYADGA